MSRGSTLGSVRTRRRSRSATTGTYVPPFPVTSSSSPGTASGASAATIQPVMSPRKSFTGAVITTVSPPLAAPRSSADWGASVTEISSSFAPARSAGTSIVVPRSACSCSPRAAPPPACRTSATTF